MPIDKKFVTDAIKEAKPFIKLPILLELVGKWFSSKLHMQVVIVDCQPPHVLILMTKAMIVKFGVF